MSSGQLGRIGRFTAFLLGSVVVLGYVSDAKATLVAYDGFDYSAGAVLKDLNGGTGWTSPWNDTDTQASTLSDPTKCRPPALLIWTAWVTPCKPQGLVCLIQESTGPLTVVAHFHTAIPALPGSVSWRNVSDRTMEIPPTARIPAVLTWPTFDLSDVSGANQERLNLGPKNSNSYWNDPTASPPTQVDYVQFRNPQMAGGLLETNLPNKEVTRPTPNIGVSPAGNFNGQARDAFANVLVTQTNLYVDPDRPSWRCDDAGRHPRLDQSAIGPDSQ